MFLEMVNCVWILINFDQNPANYDEKIAEAATAGDVQNSPGELYQYGS